ncbi:MAG TPA: acetate--CoA ligase, partial [bacterium]
FSNHAHIKSMEEYEEIYKRSIEDPEGFWDEIARDFVWFEPYTKVLDWVEPHAKWFVGGKTNVCYNCLDRHLETWKKNRAAIIWEGEPGDKRTFTYQQLHHEVCKFANGLKSLGVEVGDRVTLYMPMIPELPIAMLACARIGAIHSVVFGGFSAEALKDRIQDQDAKIVITADHGWRRGKTVPLKKNTDDAIKDCPSIEKCIVVKRVGEPIDWNEKVDVWWDDLMEGQSACCMAEPLDSEHMLYILYTSGTTGKPKGIVHTTGGYMVQAAYTTKIVFDIKEEDTYWCTADIGWVTGHSYIVYGPLALGATTLMYEGAPNYPDEGRFWDIVDRYQVNIFYTAPTAIRAFMKWGNQHPEARDLSSLRLLGTVGEPINPEAWMWYHEKIGHEKCPIVDTWWQTETGSIMISPLPGATPAKPGSCTLPLPGVDAAIVNSYGEEVPHGKGGMLAIRKPWPGMLRTLYKDDDRYKSAYWQEIDHMYKAGDSARRDDDGYFWIMGRLDDVLNVSGHRLGTMEVESALVAHPKVCEAAVVGMPDELTGEAICAFVTLESGFTPGKDMVNELKGHVVNEIGALARPKVIHFTDALPKTRSGKIMRRLLKEIASGSKPMGDTTTLEDHSVLINLSDMAAKEDEA